MKKTSHQREKRTKTLSTQNDSNIVHNDKCSFISFIDALNQ